MDTDLVVRAQRGDKEAYADLAFRIADRFLAVSRRILRDVDLAEDATQQALLSIWQDLPQLRDTTRIVRSWLRAEENDSADRILGVVLERLDTTPQRRATWWPARRFPEMNHTAKLALGAAAVVVVALLGIG